MNRRKQDRDLSQAIFEKISIAFCLIVLGAGLGYWWAVEAYGVLR